MKEESLVYISTFSGLLPLMVFIIFSRWNIMLQSGVILLYISYSLLNDVFVVFFADNFNSEFGTFLFNSLFTIIEHVLISFFFFTIVNGKKFKLIIKLFSALFVSLAIIILIFSFNSSASFRFDTLASSISSFTLLSYSIIFFYEKIQNPEITFIYATFEFWVVVGIMIYFSGTFFLFINVDNLSDQELNKFWIINLVCNIFKNLLFAVGALNLRSKELKTNNY